MKIYQQVVKGGLEEIGEHIITLNKQESKYLYTIFNNYYDKKKRKSKLDKAFKKELDTNLLVF
jgi:hypothetical protein